MQVEILAITANAERLIERAARTCYQSESRSQPGSEKKLIRKLLENGHHSVFEHGYAMFGLKGVSRALTHQLVRHRLCSYSQQSQRFVNEANFQFVEPPSIAGNSQAHAIFKRFMGEVRRTYVQLQQLGVRNEDARFVLTNAVCTEIVVSANFRQLRHIFCVRCTKHAQWELRAVALQMLRIVKEKAPSVFADFVVDEGAGTAHTPYPS